MNVGRLPWRYRIGCLALSLLLGAASVAGWPAAVEAVPVLAVFLVAGAVIALPMMGPVAWSGLYDLLAAEGFEGNHIYMLTSVVCTFAVWWAVILHVLVRIARRIVARSAPA